LSRVQVAATSFRATSLPRPVDVDPDDFALSQVTDRELKNNTTGDEEIMNRVEMENTVSTSNRTDSQQENLEIDKATTSQNVLEKKEDKKLLSPQEFRGYPKAKE
jgi:hypothetical protein